jgi:deoxyribonuclease V
MRRPSTQRNDAAAALNARLTLPEIPDLAVELAARIQAVPRGSVTTFGDLARSLGDRHAAVWVSRWIAEHTHDATCACHRVVRSTGEIPGIGEASRRQYERLLDEGVPSAVDQNLVNPRVELSRRVTDWPQRPPLAGLQDWLDAAAATVRETSFRKSPKLAAGFDVAYRGDGAACGAAVVMDVRTLSVVWSAQEVQPPGLPYIPGYLTFRELPVLIRLVERMRREGIVPDISLIDGQGRLHPRRAGIAVGFAAVTGFCTIGVGKSLLCGRVEPFLSGSNVSSVVHEGERLAVALRREATGKPIFVSVGGGIFLDQAGDLAQRLRKGRRLPEPVHQADRLSKQAAHGAKPRRKKT